MKVYIITNEPFPNGMAATGRIKSYTKALNDGGLECEVLICKRTEVYSGVSRNLVGESFDGNVRFQYISKSTRRARNILLRQYHDLLDKYDTLKFIKNDIKQEDVIILYMRENPFSMFIMRVAHKKGIKVVRDLCEYPYGIRKASRAEKLKRSLYMNFVFPKFNGVISISEALYDFANKYKGKSCKLIKIPILLDPDRMKCREAESDQLITKRYLFHSGTLTQQKDGVVDILRAFSIAIQKLPYKVSYFFTGKVENSPDSKMILSIIDRCALKDSVVFLGYLNEPDLAKYLMNANGFIINKLDNQQNKYCFSTKLGEYLLSGRPIITTSVGESNRFLEDRKSAFIVEPNNIEDLADRIVELFTNDQQSEKVGAEGKKVALANFLYSSQSNSLVDYIKSL